MAQGTVGDASGGSLQERLQYEVLYFKGLNTEAVQWRSRWSSSIPEEGRLILLAEQAKALEDMLEHQETLDRLREEWEGTHPESDPTVSKLAEELTAEMEGLLEFVHGNLELAGGLREGLRKELQEVRQKIQADQSYEKPERPAGTFFMDRKI